MFSLPDLIGQLLDRTMSAVAELYRSRTGSTLDALKESILLGLGEEMGDEV